MDVGRDGDFQFLSDRGQNFAAVTGADSEVDMWRMVPDIDLLDHLIKRVQSQMWQRLFAQFLAVDVPLGSVLGCHTTVPIRGS